MDQNEKRMYEIFNELQITNYEVVEHQVVTSIDEVDEYDLSIADLNVKNLLLKEKKSDKYYLVIIDEHKKLDTKHFKEVAGWKKVQFSNDEQLMEVLGLPPRSVTPLSLFNDVDKKITVVLGKDIVDASDEKTIGHHPCRNNATLLMTKGDFMKFLNYVGNEVILELKEAEVE